jgi:hypothetical protein
MNTNSNTTSTTTSPMAAIWADMRNAQRRMNELNRPWTAKKHSR